MTHLRELLASDLSKKTDEELADGVREAEMLFRESQKWSGRLAAELRRRDRSWAVIVKLTEVKQANLRRRVAKFEEGDS